MTHPTHTFVTDQRRSVPTGVHCPRGLAAVCIAICLLVGSAAPAVAQVSSGMRPKAGPKGGQVSTAALLARAEAGVRSALRASQTLTPPVAAKIRTRAYVAAQRNIAALLQRPDAADDQTRRRIVRLRQASRALRTIPTSAALSSPAAAATGAINGTVTGQKGEPLGGVTLWASEASSYFFTSATTNADGTYTLAGLPDGEYYVLTQNNSGWLDEYYDDVACGIGECTLRADGQVPEFDKVTVTDGVARTGIDFSLVKGGTIAGVVTDAMTGAPISGAVVHLTLDGNYASETTETDAQGRFHTRSGLPSGTYRAQFFADGYISQYLGGTYSCDYGEPCGAPIAVTIGETTGDVDVALSRGGHISGSITDSGTGSPIAGVIVMVSDGNTFEELAVTDGAGHYDTAGALPPGEYFVRTFSREAGYLDEGYDNVACDQRCSLPAGSFKVPVGKAEHVSGIDFALDRGAFLAGTVTAAATGQPVAGTEVWVESVANGTTHYDSFGTTDAAGNYTTQDPIATGSYLVFVPRRDVYLGSAWPGLPCFTDCMEKATPMMVVAGDTLPGINFALVRGGSISGRARDARTKLPIPGITVRLFDALGHQQDWVETDEEGDYALRGLAGGFYFLAAEDGNDRIYTSVVLGGAFCPPYDCDPTGGRPVHVVGQHETAHTDFLLDVGGAISGTVRSAETGQPVMWATIFVLDRNSGVILSTATTQADGTYRTREPLPAGKFHVFAYSTEHQDELYNNVPCETSCSAVDGTPVTVRPGENTQSIDFDLMFSH